MGPIPYRVVNFFNFATKNILVNSINHEVSPEIIAIQTKAMEIPLVQFEVTWGTFVDKFKTMILCKIEPTVEGVVFGVEEGDEIDTHGNPLRQVCR